MKVASEEIETNGECKQVVLRPKLNTKSQTPALHCSIPSLFTKIWRLKILVFSFPFVLC